MRKTFIRLWAEGLEADEVEIPDLELPEEDLAVQEPQGPDSLEIPEGEDEEPPKADPQELVPQTEGTEVGNLGAEIVSTLVEWVDEDTGFLSRTRNEELLSEGIEKLQSSIREFNQKASRIVAKSTVEAHELREIQVPWMSTLGIRLNSLKGPDREKALDQLRLLAPKLEKKWNNFVSENELGISVTNPRAIEAPGIQPPPRKM